MAQDLETLRKIVKNSHATIVEIPRGYGFDFAKKQIELGGDFEILDFLPTIHANQKTEIINADDIDELRAKLRGKSRSRQVVIFHDAEKMNEPAQNKFLKMLEEPRNNLSFVLLVNSAENLLQTVRSRAQIVKISPISKEESEAILRDAGCDSDKIRKIIFLAEGLPQELKTLATDKKYFEKSLQTVELAKKWLTGNNLDRFAIIAKMKDRESALIFLEALLKISRATLPANMAQKTAHDMERILRAHEAISKNANIKIQLTKIILKK